MVRIAHYLRRLPGNASYLIAATAALAVNRSFQLQASFDDHSIDLQNVRMMTIANGQYIDGGPRISQKSGPDNWLMEPVMVVEPDKLVVAGQFPSLVTGSHLELAQFQVETAIRIVVSSPVGLPVEADGEVVGITSTAFDFSSARLRCVSLDLAALHD